ncbi:hypothetical protein [Streptomyces sp. NPDC002044]
MATPSGGRHLYFAAPDGSTIGSFSGNLKNSTSPR